MDLPATVADLLCHPTGKVARIVVRHERRSELRWLGFIELFLVVLACVCAVPCLAVWMFLVPEDGAVGPNERGFFDFVQKRLWRRYHDVTLTFFGPGGAQVGQVRHTPRSAAEGDALLGSVLAVAAREGIVLVETIGAEVCDVFFGGAPLMARPEALDVDAIGSRLRAAGMSRRGSRIESC